MDELSAVQSKKNAAVAIVFVYGLNSQHSNRWDSTSNLEWCRERLPKQHTEARIMAYGFEDLCIQSSGMVAVNKAAKNLLSKLDGSQWAKRTSSSNDLTETGDALILARSHSGPHSISQRVVGIIFLGTPHIDDVQIWADRIGTATDLGHKNSRSRRATETLKKAEEFVELTKDFQELSSLYVIMYFCDEDWLECSGATVLHSDCLWSMVSQDYLRYNTKENHYILPRSTTTFLSMAYVERATVGMRKLAASRESYHKCLESEWATKSLYAGERLTSTCNWVFDHNAYVEWALADGPACLWISGVSGTGKTILSSAIVDDLLASQQKRDVIAYCFLEEGFGKDDFAQRILEVLFRQLFNHRAVPDVLMYTLLPEIEAVDSPMSREAFQCFLRSLLENSDCQTRIVLVLDGVDKDEWVKCMVIDEVTHINSSRHRSDFMRCLISSRESCDYNTHMGHCSKISLDNELGVQRDVLRFAESRLARLCPTTPNAKLHLTSVGKRICLQGRGNFLWVALVIESLQCTVSITEVEKEVQFLPSTIEGLYQRALQHVPSQEIETVQRIFAWLIAAHRPLGLPELVGALAIEPDPHRPPGIGTLATRIWNTECPEAEIRRICSPLIITTRENTVKFRHPSVRKQLLSAGETGIWGTSIVEAHTLLAQTCLMLVTPEEDEDSSLRGLRRLSSRSRDEGCASKLKNYASTNWAFHYGLVESHSKRLVSTLHRSLTLTLHHDCEELLLPEMGRPCQIATTILRVAAYHGFTSLTRVSLEMGINQNCSCNSCEMPLVLAAAGGHSKVAALLIQRGASTTASASGGGETALHLAAAYGYQDIVKLLLKNDAKADSSAGYLSRTPLHAAAFSGNLDIIKLFMNHDVDLNAMIPISGETPLHLAASRGHLQAVEWLLEGLGASDEEMDVYDSMVQQQYYHAWKEGILTTVSASTRSLSPGTEAKSFAQESMRKLQSLCGRYADINMRTQEGRTALHLAASNGHAPTVRFLLQKGANVDLADNNRCTALRLAAENGHFNAVKLLLMAGGDLNADFQQLGATLKSVTDNGHDTVANLLAWHYFSAEVMGKPCQWPVLALATKSKLKTVRDTIREKFPRDRSTTRSIRTQASSQDRRL